MTAVLGRWLYRCELALRYLGVLATFAMMCLTSADALSRYTFNRPIMGAYEITEKYLMVAAIFLGLSYGYRGGLFIRVTFLVDRLSSNARIVADYFAFLVSLAFSLFFLWATAIQGWRGLHEDTELSTLPILVGPAYCLVPIGFLALTIVMLVDLPRVRNRQALLFTQDAPAAS
jgi:TRAP-type C4-dicarboxylate transport system permease small subunit